MSPGLLRRCASSCNYPPFCQISIGAGQDLRPVAIITPFDCSEGGLNRSYTTDCVMHQAGSHLGIWVSTLYAFGEINSFLDVIYLQVR